MFEIDPDLDLHIERLMRCRPETIWRCWAEPELFKQWFTPPTVKVIDAQNDLRPGGRAFNVMQLQDGTTMPNDGSFILAEPYRRLIYTDALLAGFRPSPNAPFMTVDLRLIPQPGGQTLYAAHIMHSSAENRAQHEEMGFAEGWGTTLAQLAALVETLE